jgi:hypothetical protein
VTPEQRRQQHQYGEDFQAAEQHADTLNKLGLDVAPLSARTLAVRARPALLAASDLVALTRELLGEAVPVAALFDWLKARPWPAAPHQKTSNGFEQLGWRIEPRLPALVATRLAEPVVTLRAKLDGGDEGTP